MSRYRGWRTRLRGMLHARATDEDLAEEMAFHLEMETAKNERLGMSPEEARRRALVVFGGTERYRAAHRDVRFGWIEDFVRDVRYGVRGFVRAPLFALTAILTLGIAIGAGAIVFSLVNGLVLRPFPVPAPERLVALWGNEEAAGATPIAYEDYLEWRDGSGIFEGLAAVRHAPLSVGTPDAGDAPADLLWSELVTPNYFAVLGLRPAAGRFFTPAETTPGSEPRLVLSHDYWQTRFGGTRAVLGQRVLVNGTAGVVIGVAPESFRGVRRFGFWPDVWVALGSQGTEGILRGRGEGVLNVIGRLRAGMSHERAEAAVTSFAQRLAQSYPETNGDFGALITSARAPFDSPNFVPPRVLTLASALSLVAVGLVLLIACANVANLMLARASAREREIAIRLAIGGSRGRLVRQLLAESSVLAAGGALLGMAIGSSAQRLSGLLVPQLQFRVGIDASVDHRVLLFTAFIALSSVFLFGLAPALRSSRADLVNGLKGESPQARRGRRLPELRDVLVVGQLAFSVVLLIAGALFVRSLTAVRTVDLGLEPEGRVLLSTNPGLSGYDATRVRAFHQEVKRRVAALPGVLAVSWGFPVPFDTYGRGLDLFVDGVTNRGDDETVGVALSVTDTDFFRALGTRLLEGRDFAQFDTVGAPLVMIASHALARRFWPSESGVGKRVRLGGAAGREAQIIGVVQDAVYFSPTQAPQPMAFLPMGQHSSSMGLTLVTHTRDEPAATVARIRGIVRDVDPGIAVYGTITMRRAVRNAMSVQESAAMVSGVLGTLALLLAVVGLYGVVAYTVDRRKREVGIRMALGATRTAVLVMVLRRAARTALIGLGIGVTAAVLTGQLMSSLLFQVRPVDPLVFGTVALAMTVVVLAASYIPARRAARVDPIVTLRGD